MKRTGVKRFPTDTKLLTLVSIGLSILVVILFTQRHSLLSRASPVKSTLTTVNFAENALNPSEILVVDGDTIRVRGRTIRLVGFDAPETGNRARCPRERELADRATARLRDLVADGGIELRTVPCACAPGTEGTSACNFGRACGYLRARGRDVGSTLIAQGLAKPFHCGTYSCPPQSTWC